MKRGSLAAAGLLFLVLIAAAIRTATPFPARKLAKHPPAPHPAMTEPALNRLEESATGPSIPMSVQTPRESGDFVSRECTNDSPGTQLADQHEMCVKIAHLLELAFMVFDQGKYDSCRKLCDKILMISPYYCVALELRDDAAKAAVRPEYATYLRKKIADWRSCTSEEEATIPCVTSCEIPLRGSEWVEVRRTGPMRVTLAGTDLDLDQWISVLAAAGVSIRLLDRPDRSDRVTLHTGEIPVEEALDLIAVLFGLTWDREDGSGIVLRRSPP